MYRDIISFSQDLFFPASPYFCLTGASCASPDFFFSVPPPLFSIEAFSTFIRTFSGVFPKIALDLEIVFELVFHLPPLSIYR